MAVSVSIQETTVTPTNDGYVVQLGISDKPLDALNAALRLTLRVRIDRKGTARLVGIQRRALDEMVDALKPLMSGLYDKLQED